jgi:hypothetical protein
MAARVGRGLDHGEVVGLGVCHGIQAIKPPPSNLCY